MMKDQIDILLATYQGGSYLQEQLESLMRQSYSHFRLYIRDDGSTDETLSIIESFRQTYPDRICVIPSIQRLGGMGNFSELMKHSTANYIMFCDQDDIWLPHKIEWSFRKIKELENQYGSQRPLLIHTDLTVVDKNLKVLSNSFWNYSKLNPHLANSLNRTLPQNTITGCTMLINKPLLQLAAPIPKDAIMHDWWLGLVASAFGKIDFLSKPTILYRQHGKNEIGAKNHRGMAIYLSYTKKVFQQIDRQELRHRLLRTFHQASQFLNRYEPNLEPEAKKIVQNYVTLSTSGALKKRYLFIKYRYFKNNLTKNLGMFLFL
jgi:glycosyltransferase involved in cell wall biosynthesis